MAASKGPTLQSGGKIELEIVWEVKYGQKRVNEHLEYLDGDHNMDEPLDFI